MTLPFTVPATLPELSLSHIQAILAAGDRPFVTLKAAATLDGRIAMPDGDSRWITGEPARELGHRLRACHSAVLVGIGTVLADNPALTVRLPEAMGANSPAPARIVLDSRCRVPTDAKVLAKDGAVRLLIAGSEAPLGAIGELRERGVRVFRAPTTRPEPAAFLPWLRRQGVERVLVEGGAAVHATFIAKSTADTLFLFLAGRVIGDPDAPSWCGALGISRLSDTPRLRLAPPRMVGEDVLLFGKFESPTTD